MAKSDPKPVASQSRLFVLALGLLVGFVIAFVFLLSRLPVDSIISQYNGDVTQQPEVADMNFDYYSVLQAQKAARKPAPQVVVAEPPIVFMEPPSRIQPQRPVLPESQIAQRVQPVEPPIQPRVQSPQSTGPEVQTPPVQRQQVQQPQVQQPQVQQPQVQQPQVQQAPQATRPPVQQPQIVQPKAQPQPQPKVQVKEILASESGQDAYFVEAGNYPDNQTAERAQNSLLSLGLDAFIVVRQDSQGAFGHRVRIGPISEQSRLDTTRQRLRASGIRSKVIRVKG